MDPAVAASVVTAVLAAIVGFGSAYFTYRKHRMDHRVSLSAESREWVALFQKTAVDAQERVRQLEHRVSNLEHYIDVLESTLIRSGVEVPIHERRNGGISK